MAASGGRLAHLLFGIVQSHDARADSRQVRRGHRERFAVEGIEALRDVARQFQMLRSDRRPPAQSRLDTAEYRRPSAPDIAAGRRRWFPALPIWPCTASCAPASPPASRRSASRRVRHAPAPDDCTTSAECLGSMPIASSMPASSSILARSSCRLLIDRDRVQVDDAVDAIVVILDLGPVLQARQDNSRCAGCRLAGCRRGLLLSCGLSGNFYPKRNFNHHAEDIQDQAGGDCARRGDGHHGARGDGHYAPEATVIVDKWVYGGEGLARVDGRVVLAPFVLPGRKGPRRNRRGVHAVC